MGKHRAVAGADVHPLVAAALQQREQTASAPNVVTPLPSTALGWPGAPAAGRGLGWPGAPVGPSSAGVGAVPAGPAGAERAAPPVTPEPAVRRFGWRRFFGSSNDSDHPSPTAA